MPKQMYTLNNFSGGINNLKDPRDLAANELANGVDIMIDQQGAIRTRGVRLTIILPLTIGLLQWLRVMDLLYSNLILD